MTEQVERDGYDQFWDVVESAPVHQGHIAQPIDALRSAWLVRDLTEDDFRAARAAIAALTVTPQEAAKVREAVGKQATEVNRAFIIAANARPAGGPQAIYEVELILERAVKALRAISEDSHE